MSQNEREFGTLLSFMLMKFVRASYSCLNGFTQLVSGYSLSTGKSSDKKDSHRCYEKSAHIIDVKMKNRKFELEGPDLSHFVFR